MDFTGYYDFDKSIITIANDFYEAYQRCIEPKNTRIDKWGRIDSSVVNVPALVNGAFACELYIKSLLPPKTSGHYLDELFNQLSDKYQAQIIEIAEKKNRNNEKFLTTLEKFRDTFCYWRYIHERQDFGELQTNGSLEFLSVLIDALKQVANNNV